MFAFTPQNAPNIKKTTNNSASTKNPKKRSLFDAFFAERRNKFHQRSKEDRQPNNNKKHKPSPDDNECNLMPDIVDIDLTDDKYDHLKDVHDVTFEDLLVDGDGSHNQNYLGHPPPKKRAKLSHTEKFAQGWYCSVCTVENGDMSALKCYLCESPRNFEETLKYPPISPVTLPHENDDEEATHNDNNNNTVNQDKHDEHQEEEANEEAEEESDFVMVNKPDEDSENKENDVDNNEIVIRCKDNELSYLTWNVWFNEELNVLERMQAIGEHIEARQADIVCLQEVTPLILDILQGAAWCKQYQSTILPNHGYFRDLRYFNVILTKHEFIRDSIQFKPFDNSVMGRHLIITPIRLKNKGKYSNKVIYAATSHLESPVGTYQGGKKDKYSAERKQQLKYSLNVLDNQQICENNNVIFGGDMNWCKPNKNGSSENDGDMNKHLNAHWVDCYHKLYPNEEGYTYDCKSNGMLSGYLQNRVDRVLYKENGDLKLQDIEIIGREAIPNLRYKKVFNRKSGSEEKMLPVLPSDHYGLFATFAFK